MVADPGLRLRRPPKESPRRFGFVMAGACGVVAALLAWQGKGSWWYLAALGGGFAALALVAPRVLGPVRSGWMRLAEPMGRVGNAVVLTVFFFMVFTPFSLLVRLFGHDRLDVRGRARPSYWRPLKQDEPSDYSQPF
jgi:hypothetical protein